VVNMKDGRVKSDRRQEARNAREALVAAVAQREREHEAEAEAEAAATGEREETR
jgi:hypothetical protein